MVIHCGSTYSPFAQSVENDFEDKKTHKLAEEHEAGLNKRMIERPEFASVPTHGFNFVSPSVNFDNF